MALTPQDPLVGGIVLRKPAIQSPDYVPGVSGWAIKIDGTAEFNSGTFRGLVTAASIMLEGSTGQVLVYSGPPAAGNLIGSISGAAGVDDEGNDFAQGISSATAVDYASLLQTTTPNAALVFGVAGQPYDVDAYRFDDGTAKWLRTSRSIRADVQMTTPVISALVSGTPETWHTISLDANWSSGAGQSPQYRLLPDGSVQLKGTLTHTTGIVTGGVNINSGTPLAAPYIPAASVYVRAGDTNRAGVLMHATGIIGAFGNGTVTLVDLAGTYWPGS